EVGAEVIFQQNDNAFFFQDLLHRRLMDRLVVADNPIKIENDRFEHSLLVSDRYGLSWFHPQDFQSFQTAGEFHELLRGSRQRRERAEVHGNYFLDSQQLASIGSFPWAHRKEIADGQHCQIRPVKFPNEFHVAEKIGIASVVNLKPAGKLNHISDGLAAVDNLSVVQNSATMVGMHHGQAEILDPLGPAL